MAHSFKSFISQNRSKTHIKAIASEVLENPHLFKELIKLVADKDTFIANKETWAMSYIVEKDLKMVSLHLTQLYKLLFQQKVMA